MAIETLNTMMDRLLLLIRAGHPIIYLVTHEEARVMEYMAKIVRVLKCEPNNTNKHLLSWYAGIGLRSHPQLTPAAMTPNQPNGRNWLAIEGFPNGIDLGQPVIAGADNAQVALQNIQQPNPGANMALHDCVAVFFDLHPHLRIDSSVSQVRQLRNTAKALRNYYDVRLVRNQHHGLYRTVIIVAPGTENLSMELERDVVVEYFPLPEISELRRTLIMMLPDKDAQPLLQAIGEHGTVKGQLEFAEDLDNQEERLKLCDMIAGAGRGLTLEDYKLGLNMFSVQTGTIEARHIEDMLNLKAKTISNQALQYTPHVQIDLGGLSLVKEWIKIRHDAVISQTVRQKYHLPPPKGVMLCGISGGGKSQLAKLIAKDFNLALLRLDVGALFGSYVGESEERTRRALQLAEVLAPVVVWIDEIDKAFSGIGNSGDNGVSARVFGHFLTWLAEKADSVFVVVTANDFRTLLDNFPEFGRKGRFDQIFWVDLPSAKARYRIFEIYLKKHYDSGYLYIDDDAINFLLNYYPALRLPDNVIDDLREQAKDDNHLRFLCLLHLLSDDNLSQNMTGAEIEHAINDALYGTYNSIKQQGRQERLMVDEILKALEHAKASALYQPASPDFPTLITLRSTAQAKGWPFADEL